MSNRFRSGRSSARGDHSTGAFCLAHGTPPIDQITTLACRAEVRRKVQITSVEGECPVLIDTDVPMIHRTLLPESWFESSSKWQLVLARRWKFPMHISRGETRASVMWLHILSSIRSFHNLDIVDLTDNMATDGCITKGRSSVHDLNRECRKRCAIEAFSGIRWLSTWTDTYHQPADGGTRPTASGL